MVKFYDCLQALMIGGIKHDACVCLLSGVGVDGHMGPSKQ